jgi:8-oxo-dGTP pyrophosphatase MutT (NUDIX family)
MMMAAKTKKPRAGATPRLQFAALPWRVGEGGVIEILLATSRDTKRWVIPKGWPMKGRKPHIAAKIEAMQEAGLSGRIDKNASGFYDYEKRLRDDVSVSCRVEVFALRVEKQKKRWPEKNQRATRWFPYALAAGLVDEPQLQALIRAFGDARKVNREDA